MKEGRGKYVRRQWRGPEAYTERKTNRQTDTRIQTLTHRTTDLVAVAEEIGHALVAVLRVAGVRAVVEERMEEWEGMVTWSVSRF